METKSNIQQKHTKIAYLLLKKKKEKWKRGKFEKEKKKVKTEKFGRRSCRKVTSEDREQLKILINDEQKDK